MKLSIAADYVVNIADILEEYILDEIKSNSNNFDIVNSLCTFYRALKDVALTPQNTGEYVTIEVEGMLRRSVPDMIKNHIDSIVKDADSLDVIAEITNMYNCLKDGTEEPVKVAKAKSTVPQQKKKKNTNNVSGGDGNKSSVLDVKDVEYLAEDSVTADPSESETIDEFSVQENNENIDTNINETDNIIEDDNPDWDYDEDELY